MSTFRRWVLTVVTMVSVATAVLLVTGWGSAVASSLSTSVVVANPTTNPAKVHEQGIAKVAVQNLDASGNIRVHEQGTANVNVTDLPSTQAVSGSVSVSNFPTVPTTSQIASGATFIAASTSADLFPLTGVSQYREVTLYLDFIGAKNLANDVCAVQTEDTANTVYKIDQFTAAGNGTIAIKTYDPAPPSIRVTCANQDTNDETLHWMLVGRTG